MVSKIDHTVDYGFKSWSYCQLWFQKLTILSTMLSKVDHTVDCRDFKKIIATIATGRLSIFRGFCCGLFIGFQWGNGRIRTKWPQNLQKFPSKSTVDYVADPRSCNSWLFSRKLTILSTMVSRVDHTVDCAFKSWPDCRLRFPKLTGLSTSKIFIQRLSTSQKKVLQQSIYDQKSTVDLQAWDTVLIHSICFKGALINCLRGFYGLIYIP